MTSGNVKMTSPCLITAVIPACCCRVLAGGGCRPGTCRTVSPGRQAASCSVCWPAGADSSNQASSPPGDQVTANPKSPCMTAPGDGQQPPGGDLHDPDPGLRRR